MPAKNLYHDSVVEALIADGWTITDDPLRIRAGRRNLYVDLAADRGRIGAAKDGERIAVEIQSFVADSDLDNLHRAVGQYAVYRAVLGRGKTPRKLFLAVSQEVFSTIFAEPMGQWVVADLSRAIVTFDPENRRIVEWKS